MRTCLPLNSCSLLLPFYTGIYLFIGVSHKTHTKGELASKVKKNRHFEDQQAQRPEGSFIFASSLLGQLILTSSLWTQIGLG